MSTSKRPSWSTIVEALRWRGPFIFLLVGLREICRPLVYWYVFHIFEVDLDRQSIPQPYADAKIEVKIYPGQGDLESAKAEINSMGQLETAEVNLRLDRGDKVAIAYINGEPSGYGWLCFASGALELAFGVVWTVGPHEAIRYDHFVLPKWRGRRISSCLHSAIVACARDNGILRTFASISSVNKQSMSIANHYRRTPIMKMTLAHIRGLNWLFRRASGAPFESRFIRMPKSCTSTKCGGSVRVKRAESQRDEVC